MPKIIDYSRYVGKIINNFTLVEDLGFRKGAKQLFRYFLMKCNLCGETKENQLYEITSGRIKSCGCQPSGLKHGICYTKLYRIFSGMKTRCYGKTSKPYKNYGGRGIKIHQEWLDDVSLFFDWAMKNGYEEGLEIERIDNDGNYEPDNCRFATRVEQANNRRTNKFIEYNGIRLTVSQWSAKLGMSRHGVKGRLNKGWSIERALTQKNRYEKC